MGRVGVSGVEVEHGDARSGVGEAGSDGRTDP